MYQFLFKYKWAAFAFVILTLVSVQVLVGREGEKGVISLTQDQLLEQRQHLQQAKDDLGNDPAAADVVPPDAGSATNTEDPEVGLGDDEELIDEAAGLDPTPEEEQPPEPDSDVDTSNE